MRGGFASARGAHPLTPQPFRVIRHGLIRQYDGCDVTSLTQSLCERGTPHPQPIHVNLSDMERAEMGHLVTFGYSFGLGGIELQTGLFIFRRLREHPQPNEVTPVNPLNRETRPVIIVGA